MCRTGGVMTSRVESDVACCVSSPASCLLPGPALRSCLCMQISSSSVPPNGVLQTAFTDRKQGISQYSRTTSEEMTERNFRFVSFFRCLLVKCVINWLLYRFSISGKTKRKVYLCCWVTKFYPSYSWQSLLDMIPWFTLCGFVNCTYLYIYLICKIQTKAHSTPFFKCSLSDVKCPFWYFQKRNKASTNQKQCFIEPLIPSK